jgi:tRNA nucleotidyltransferase (CCA-adding enzyme)
MILTSEADIRGRAGFENDLYPQGGYLRQAYEVANTVSIKEVVASGLQGIAIRDELTRRREQALAEWKLIQNIISD